ncbi:MAG TPA: tRNA (adenosine(37)-N6)-threonylcarbamoyltransferase complex ATPase subunit type 1 TsaE [Clostridia bacterium]|nr:tRNA (adenosine(37)-N6)-threonylcarbamoyltransferase complex ATPase subunit type 1 TsaE [Clostridia bacterium]
MPSFSLITNSSEETFEIAFKLGKMLSKGEVVTLDGNLGAGKTLFTQGLARALGITEPVTSPTFAILNIYTTGDVPLYHFDVYRISSYDELVEIGYEEYNQGDGIIVIEWAKNIPELEYEERLVKIDIERLDGVSENTRRITIKTYEGKELTCLY